MLRSSQGPADYESAAPVVPASKVPSAAEPSRCTHPHFSFEPQRAAWICSCGFKERNSSAALQLLRSQAPSLDCSVSGREITWSEGRAASFALPGEATADFFEALDGGYRFSVPHSLTEAARKLHGLPLRAPRALVGFERFRGSGCLAALAALSMVEVPSTIVLAIADQLALNALGWRSVCGRTHEQIRSFLEERRAIPSGFLDAFQLERQRSFGGDDVCRCLRGDR